MFDCFCNYDAIINFTNVNSNPHKQGFFKTETKVLIKVLKEFKLTLYM